MVEVAHRGKARLFAREMDAAAALAKFAQQHRPTLARIADRGTFLDQADIKELLDLSLPGMDEVMALLELSDSDRVENYARIVVDTAPSGHTSRLLLLPAVFAHWIGALERLAEKHRFMISQFTRGRQREDDVDLFLRELAERLERVRAMLYDPAVAAFMLVTIPEAMSIEETSRYFAFLRRERLPVTDLVINRVESEHDDCPFCRARVSAQKPHLKQIAREFGALRMNRVPQLSDEVRGLKALRSFARLTWEPEGAAAIRRRDGNALVKRPGVRVSRANRTTIAASSRLCIPEPFVIEPKRLLIFGGKGGVGKTTMAAAAALALAKSDSTARVVVFSTDPAHSLSDSFGEKIGERKTGLGGQKNLDGMEINPAARFEEFKTGYRAWTDDLFDSLTAGSRWEIQFDREAMRELVALAPPGIDEIAALSAISDLLKEGVYKSIVLDTAPTGHLVRLLELPDLALAWVHTFMKLLLKYKDLMRDGSIAEDLLAMAKNIKPVAALLADATDCEFIGVAIAERMSLEETVRLTKTLGRLKVPMRSLVINNVIPAEAAAACDFCAARRGTQLKVIEAFRRSLKDMALFVAPQQPHEPRGRKRLSEHFASCYRLDRRAGGRVAPIGTEKQ
jgi:arsenite-transporting ATPase